MTRAESDLDVLDRVDIDFADLGGCAVIGCGERIELSFDNWSDVRKLLAPFPSGGRQHTLSRLVRLFHLSGLRMEFSVAGRIVAVLRNPESRGVLPRLLGLAPLELRLRECVRAWWSLRLGSPGP